MIPADVVVDLSGPRRLRGVRIIDGTAYAEARTHPDGHPVPDHPGIVSVVAGLPDAEEVRPGKRWMLGEWTAAKTGGCSCKGTFRALRAFTP